MAKVLPLEEREVSFTSRSFIVIDGMIWRDIGGKRHRSIQAPYDDAIHGIIVKKGTVAVEDVSPSGDGSLLKTADCIPCLLKDTMRQHLGECRLTHTIPNVMTFGVTEAGEIFKGITVFDIENCYILVPSDRRRSRGNFREFELQLRQSPTGKLYLQDCAWRIFGIENRHICH